MVKKKKEEKKEECDHNYQMFHDNKLKGSGFLSFYCKKCLALKIVKKEYRVEQAKR